jgi:hypothetical protein
MPHLSRVNLGNAHKYGLGLLGERESWWSRRLVRKTRYPTKSRLKAKVYEIVLELGFAMMRGVTSIYDPLPGGSS